MMQFRHFQTTAEALHLNPGRPSKNFSELCSFVAHVYYCYPKLAETLQFEQIIFRTLGKEPERLHHSIRRSLVQSAFLLRSRGCIPYLKCFQELFKLNGCEDKDLRKQLHNGLIAEISNSTTTTHKNKKRKTDLYDSPAGECRRQTQTYLVQQLQATNTPVALARAAAGLLVALFKKGVWSDGACANAIADTCILHSDSKVSSAAIHLFLGNFKMAVQLLSAEEDESAKATKAKKKEGESDNDEDASKAEGVADYRGLDLLHDPQSVAEKLFARLMKQDNAMSFDLRILLTQLVARMVGRHQLLVLNLYPYLMRYMKPHLSAVTKALAAVTEATHELVPPEELHPVVKHLMDNFVSDHCKPEVIALGLNSLRLICSKCPLCVTGDQLAMLVAYREHKTSKTVVGAARALLNLYRQKFPELLHARLRGRDAAISVQAGQGAVPLYGVKEGPKADLDGIDRLKKRKRQEEGDEESEVEEEESEVEDEESEAEDAEDGEEGEVLSDDASGSELDDEEELEEQDDDSELESQDDYSEDDSEISEDSTSISQSPEHHLSIAAERILTDDDFRRMRKKKDEDSSSSEEEQDSFQAVNPDALLGSRRVNSALSKKQQRVDSIKSGRTSKDHFKNRERRGGSTNKEKIRNKPAMMNTHKRKVKQMNMSAHEKAKVLKKHIKTLKKAVGPQKRRRAH